MSVINYDRIIYIFPYMFPEFFSMTRKIKCNRLQAIDSDRLESDERYIAQKIRTSAFVEYWKNMGRFFRLFQRAIEQEVKIIKRDIVFVIRKNFAAFRRNEKRQSFAREMQPTMYFFVGEVFYDESRCGFPSTLSSTEVRL